MLTSPSVSVIIPTYNMRIFVGDAIKSVLHQTYQDFEIMIVDDGSVDGTKEVVSQFKSDRRVRYLYQDNRGPAAARNTGINESNGQFVAFLDADDLWLPEKLDKQIRAMENHPDYALVGTACYVVDTDNRKKWIMCHPCEDVHIRWLGLFNSPFVQSSVIVRRTALQEVGLYKTEKGFIMEDYDLWSRLLLRYRATNLGQPLLLYRDNPEGLSHSKRSLQEQQSIAVSTTNISQLLEDNSFTAQRGSQIRNLRNGTWSSPQREHIEEAINDLTHIYSVFLTKYKEQLGTHPTVSAAIKNDINRAYLVAAFFLSACGARSSGFRAMGHALKAEPGLCFHLRFWIALSSLIMGHRNFLRLRTLFRNSFLKRK